MLKISLFDWTVTDLSNPPREDSEEKRAADKRRKTQKHGIDYAWDYNIHPNDLWQKK